MKTFLFVVVLLAGLPAGLRAQAGNAASVEFKGHLIGEGVEDFLRIEPEVRQEVDVCRQQRSRQSCARLLEALNAGGRAEVSTTGSINFVLDGGKLAKLTMLVDESIDTAASDLTQKFGPQTQVTLLPARNSAGAQWDNRLCVWDTPVAYITVYQDNNPSMQDQRLVLTVETHAEHLLENLDSSKQPVSFASAADAGRSVKTVSF